MIVNSCALTDIGQSRTSNQDFVYGSDHPVGVFDNLYLVADGMGGHQGGGFASRYTAERLVEALSVNEDLATVRALNTAINTVNQELFRKSTSFEDLKGMGTTIVLATISNNVLVVANIGDSRLYIINDEIRQITRDHSLVEQLRAEGKITRDSEFFARKKNIITRAVGVRECVAADFFEVELNVGDRILMCSDGLTNMVSDHDIFEIISNEKDCRQAAIRLIKEGNNNGGMDNISVVVIDPEIKEVG